MSEKMADNQEVELRVRARFQEGSDGPACVHVDVFLNAELEANSSPEACGTFFRRHEAEQAGNLLHGLGYDIAALKVAELAKRLPGDV